MIGLLLSVEPPPATLGRPAIFTTHGGDGGIVGQNHMMSIVQSIDLDNDNTITNIVTYLRGVVEQVFRISIAGQWRQPIAILWGKLNISVIFFNK